MEVVESFKLRAVLIVDFQGGLDLGGDSGISHQGLGWEQVRDSFIIVLTLILNGHRESRRRR